MKALHFHRSSKYCADPPPPPPPEKQSVHAEAPADGLASAKATKTQAIIPFKLKSKKKGGRA